MNDDLRSALYKDHANKVMKDLFRDDFGDDISREFYEANRRTKEMFDFDGDTVQVRKVITPDQVTDISEYGAIINEQADAIATLLDAVRQLKHRVEYLENYISKEEKRKTFKKFVVVASSSECLAVLTDSFENFCDDIIHINKSYDNVVYYRLNEETLANGEVVFILKDFYEKWKRGKKHTVLTIEELEDRLSNGGLND